MMARLDVIMIYESVDRLSQQSIAHDISERPGIFKHIELFADVVPASEVKERNGNPRLAGRINAEHNRKGRLSCRPCLLVSSYGGRTSHEAQNQPIQAADNNSI